MTIRTPIWPRGPPRVTAPPAEGGIARQDIRGNDTMTRREQAGTGKARPHTRKHAADLIAFIAERWKDGESDAAIARQIGARFGRKISRQAVAGVIHRNNLKRGEAANIAAARARARQTSQAGRRLVAMSGPSERPPHELVTFGRRDEPAGPLVPLVELEAGQCKWPYGNPKGEGFGFCGQAVAGPARPYCERHERRASKRLTEEEAEAELAAAAGEAGGGEVLDPVEELAT